ncbi:unnamed protein product [Paramecium sonneborni]|uniref:Transmembrane protein n=1 Tax=Paramecium sonneborni TaxID=65129 RepID=A0A8S1PR40_9CILI|nr:unnamed protein product [Paramecium sonneborni]
MKHCSKLIYFFLNIGYNKERRKTKIDYGNMGMIVFYFIQLLGYVYNQFEGKQIQFYENDYLALIAQYSSITFMITSIYYDPITKFAYYCIFLIICLIYILVIFQILFKPFSTNNLVNKFISFYFKNFQWYFLTPFHECIIGITTCGTLAYLAEYSNFNPLQCFSLISPHFILITIISQLLIILTGFLSSYCYRNYEFMQGDLMRKFSYFNFITFLLHMALQISSYWREMYDHQKIITHLILNILIILLIFDTYKNIPFGFKQETIFFNSCLQCAWFFEILVALWIFSDLNDGHIFLTFCISIPLIFTINQELYNNYFDKSCQLFFKCKTNKISEHPLEFIFQLCHQESIDQSDYYLILKYLGIHCQNCCDFTCPCKQKLNKFILGTNKLNIQVIFIWVQHQFQKMIKSIMQDQNQFSYFEQITIKFVTFLQKYRENSVLSYKIIQDVVYTFKKMNQVNKPLFFQNLTKLIQNLNKTEIENSNRLGIQIELQEFRSLQDFNLFYHYEDKIIKLLLNLLVCNKSLWQQSINQSISDDNIIKFSKQIRVRTEMVKKEFINFQSQRETPAIDSILVLRIKLVVSLICKEDINSCLKIAQQIESLVQEQTNSKSFFNILQFINGQALSIVSNAQSQSLGFINQKVNDQFYEYFGYKNQYTPLTQIEQLLPNKLGRIHNGLVEAFLLKGRTKRLYANSEQFILNADNLIEKVNICLTAFLPQSSDLYQFLIIGHLLKITKYQNQEIDYFRKGYILVDSDFLIFGITRNIYERINYKYFYKNNENLELIQPDDIYQVFTIQELIPSISFILEEYYRLLTIKNQKRLIHQDIICQREIGVLSVPSSKQNHNIATLSFQTKKYTNKIMLNNLKDIDTYIQKIKTQNSKLFPIEFSVVQKVLYYIENHTTYEFVYFVIEINFLEDPKLNKLTFYQDAKTPLFLEITRRQQQQLNDTNRHYQNDIICSNDEDEMNEFIGQEAEFTNTATMNSSNEMDKQLEKIIVYMNDKVLPKSIKILIAQFIIQILVLIIFIILISNIYQNKRNLQSDCIYRSTADLNFLDAYSQTMSGSRHVIYYRDFYTLQEDTLISINNDQINFSRQDKIYISWQHIAKGSIRLIEMYPDYKKIAQQSETKLMTFYFINFDLKSKISQIVQDYFTYYQIMHQIFFFSYNSFASSPQTYQQERNDTYMTQIARSQVYYNFFDVSESVNITLEDCHIFNTEMNNYFDQIVNYYFFGFYSIIIFQLAALIIYYLKVVRTFKFYLKLFKMCDKDDCIQILNQCDFYISILSQNRIFLRLKNFELLLNCPKQILDDVRKSLNQTTVINIQKKQIKFRHIQQNSNYSNYCSILMIILVQLIIAAYVLAFHLHYHQIKNSIGPISNRAILAQEQRLNFIVATSRFDLFLIKEYFETYAIINKFDPDHQLMTRNIETDTLILNLLSINNELIQEDIIRLRLIDFTSLILHNEYQNSEINDQQQVQLLGQDVCLLTGCDMQNQLLFDKLYSNKLVPYFQTGIVNFHKKVLTFVEDTASLILKQQTQLEKAQTIEQILNDSEYLIYILWGIDIIQFQIAQFSQYFLDISSQTIDILTKNNQIIIILVGILIGIFVLIFQILFTYYQYNRYGLSKAIIKSISIPILFQRNIPKYLESFGRKYEQ